MDLSKIGQAPDYRFSLANERTYLAWIRTSLAFLAGGVALDQLSLNSPSSTLWAVLALFLCLASALLAIYGYKRWRSNEEAMRLNRDLSYTGAQGLLAFAMVVFVFAIMWCLFGGKP